MNSAQLFKEEVVKQKKDKVKKDFGNQANEQRESFFRFSLRFVGVWIVFLICFAIAQLLLPIWIYDFERIESIQIGVLFGTTTINILGFLYVIGKSLFK